MRSEPVYLGGISLDFAGISPRREKNFPMNMRKWASPAKVG